MDECKYIKGCIRHGTSFNLPEGCTFNTEDNCRLAKQYKEYSDFYNKNVRENTEFRTMFYPHKVVNDFKKKWGGPENYSFAREDEDYNEIGIGAMVSLGDKKCF